MDFLNNTDWILPLIALFFIELVLGIDNIIFISILVDKVPITKKRYTMNTVMQELFSYFWMNFLITNLMNLK